MFVTKFSMNITPSVFLEQQFFTSKLRWRHEGPMNHL
jgi:hypothetical protein